MFHLFGTWSRSHLWVFKDWRSFSDRQAIFNHLFWSVWEDTLFELSLLTIKGRKNGRAALGSKNHWISNLYSRRYFAGNRWQVNRKAAPIPQINQNEIISRGIWLRRSSGVSLILLFDWRNRIRVEILFKRWSMPQRGSATKVCY